MLSIIPALCIWGDLLWGWRGLGSVACPGGKKSGGMGEAGGRGHGARSAFPMDVLPRTCSQSRSQVPSCSRRDAATLGSRGQDPARPALAVWPGWRLAPGPHGEGWGGGGRLRLRLPPAPNRTHGRATADPSCPGAWEQIPIRAPLGAGKFLLQPISRAPGGAQHPPPAACARVLLGMLLWDGDGDRDGGPVP